MGADEERMAESNEKMKLNEPYSDLDDVLQKGMSLFSLHRIRFLFVFFIFSHIYNSLFVVTQLLFKQVKMLNIWRQKPHKGHRRKLLQSLMNY